MPQRRSLAGSARPEGRRTCHTEGAAAAPAVGSGWWWSKGSEKRRCEADEGGGGRSRSGEWEEVGEDGRWRGQRREASITGEGKMLGLPDWVVVGRRHGQRGYGK